MAGSQTTWAQVAAGTLINLGVPQFPYLYNESAFVWKGYHKKVSQAGWLRQQIFIFSGLLGGSIG